MIPVVVHGKGFGGILRYALGKDGAYLIGPVQGDVDDLTTQFGKIHRKNHRCQKPVIHMALAIHPSEYLTDKQWLDVANKMMSRLGYRRNHYVIIRHTDEPQEHIHIVGSRIRSDNYKVVDDYQENWRASSIAADLELELGLQQAALDVFKNRKKLRRDRPKRGEEAMRKERGILSTITLLQQRIDAATAGKPTVTEFLIQLERFGVGVKPNIGEDHVSGISFELNGFLIKGSKLGRGYTWARLIQKLDYNPERDLDALRNAKAQIGRDPDDLSPDAAQELKTHIIQSNLSKLGPSPNLDEAANRALAFSPVSGITRRSAWELLEVLTILGRYARKIESNPFICDNDEDDRDRDRTRRRR